MASIPSRSLTALSIAPYAHKWLIHTSQARVLHIFKHACNLITDNREVLSIVYPEIGDGPFNLLVEDTKFSFLNHLDVMSPITIESNRVLLGELIVDTHQAKIWSPKPNWEQLHAARNHIGIQLLNLNEWLHLQVPTHSMIEYLEALLIMAEVHSSIRELSVAYSKPGQRNEQPAFREMAYYPNIKPVFQTGTFHEPGSMFYAAPFIKDLCCSIVDADIRGCLRAVKRLAGLGQGLTPAGDDFILGAIFAARIIHPEALAIRLTKKIAEAASPLTTSLSAAWLKAAGRGEAGILWHHFFDALVSGEWSSIKYSANKLLMVGHTSGADSLAGFLAPFFIIDIP